MKQTPNHIALKDMISQTEAMKVTGLGKEWFRLKRKDGVIKTWKPLSNGRNIVYSRTELETLLNNIALKG